MATTMSGRARVMAIIAALTLIILSLGVGGTASADPGNDNAKGAENSAQSNASASAAASVKASDAATSPGKSDEAPGQNKSEAAPSPAPAEPVKSEGEASSHVTAGTAGTSGVVTEPQPISNADANKGGANGQCPGGAYCSTRDGSPSLNGNGEGKAVGKPCAGCVGKADNKNPKGQMPNGSDHNAGYECDTNNGIGKTNPAHTGCTTTTPPVQTCPDGSPLPCDNPNPPKCDEPGQPKCDVPPTDKPNPPTDKPNPPVDNPEPPVDNPNPPVGGPGEGTPPGNPPVDNPGPVIVPVDNEVPPTDIAGVEDEVPPVLDAPAAPRPPTALPATGAPEMMGLVGAGGIALVLLGGLTLWMQRRMGSTS
ncbi:MAG TPA: hypothetical protein VJ819_02405 [Nocardioidaceae bacterium]|nr:hypothetical protein [Nocardioidaceae bacterium]